MEASTGLNFGPATAKKSLGCETRQFVWELQLKVPAKLSRASEEVSVWQSQKFQYCIWVSTYMFGTNLICNQRPKAGYET